MIKLNDSPTKTVPVTKPMRTNDTHKKKIKQEESDTQRDFFITWGGFEYLSFQSQKKGIEKFRTPFPFPLSPPTQNMFRD